MKQHLIEKIYFGDSNYCKKLEPSAKYKKISEEANGYFKQLTEALNEEQKKLFDKFMNLQTDAVAEAEFIRFKEGVKFGFQLFMECMN